MKTKTFTVDWDDYDQVSKLGNAIKSRLGELNPIRVSRKEKFRRKLDALEFIYNIDLSSIFESLPLDPEKKYYVYAHLDTTRPIAVGKNERTTFAASIGLDYIPFYIGKGTGNRSSLLERNEYYLKVKRKISKYSRTGVKVTIMDEGLSEWQAFALEGKLIDIFGLASQQVGFKGTLTNLNEGMKVGERRGLYYKELNLVNESNIIHR